jgi:hypothetical protein
MHIRFLSANLRIVARDILLLRDDALVILSTAHAIHNVAKMCMKSHYLLLSLQFCKAFDNTANMLSKTQMFLVEKCVKLLGHK